MQKNEENDKRHIIKYTSLFGGVQIINLLASVIRNKIAAVILGPSGLGLVSLYNTAITLIGNTTNLGIPFSAIRHLSELREKNDINLTNQYIHTIRTWSLVTAILGMALCAAVSPLLSLAYFSDIYHWYIFAWLSPAVALTAIAGGELAILKGMHMMKQVAIQSLTISIGAVFTSLPFYYFLGIDGIIPSILVFAITMLLSVLYFSIHDHPFHPFHLTRKILAQGGNMIRLGLAYTIAGILGSGTEFFIRAFIMQKGTEEDVGLYNAGYVLTITYASMIFTAMETDYFPRLSAVNHDTQRSNDVVNKQIEVSLLLIAPLLVIFLIVLPQLLPLLYANSFMPVITMAQWAILGMFVRAATLPMAYLSLAKGQSKIFLLTETAYDIFAAIFITTGYAFGGLKGSGQALLLSAVADFILIWSVARLYYKFHLASETIKKFAIQAPIILGTFIIVLLTDGLSYWIAGAICIAISTIVSMKHLKKDMTQS